VFYVTCTLIIAKILYKNTQSMRQKKKQNINLLKLLKLLTNSKTKKKIKIKHYFRIIIVVGQYFHC